MIYRFTIAFALLINLIPIRFYYDLSLAKEPSAFRAEFFTSDVNVALGKQVTVTTNGANENHDNAGLSPSDITDGSLDYLPSSWGQEDGTVGYVNDDYNEPMTIIISIDLQGTYNISRIRYNMGNVQRAETWNADTMTTPFGTSSTNPGASYNGAWTEHTGSATLSNVTIVLDKTRVSYPTDWLFVGEIEIYSTSASAVVSEARLDIGMPYNTNRGCSSPYTGCGGPYHGFYKGVCTDLVLDGYNAGAPFNIQNALYQDHLANPGRYRYGSARNAEDMRRYFSYNQSLLSHSQPYQQGDIAFFDWDGDGLTNHVLVISEVDANNRPLMMVDASGVISGINPSGLAFEHGWSNYYGQHIQGHARLSSNNLASTAALSETLQELRVTVDASSVGLSLFDSNGKLVSEVYDENLVANNIEASIPYIPGGNYTTLGARKVITVTQPLSNTNQYFVKMDGQANTTYTLLIEALQDSSVTASQSFTRAIGAGESQNVGITVTAPSGVISFTAQAPTSSPAVNLPSLLSLSGLVGTSTQLTFTISETSGQQAISDASVTATDLSTQYGIKILSSQLAITPADFSVAAGGNQQVGVQISLVDLNPGEYLGSLILTSQNGNPVMIPFTLQVQYHTFYLPYIARN